MKINVIILFIILGLHLNAGAQVIPYTGGNGSGYVLSSSAIINCAQFYGGNADGAAANLSAQTVCPEFFGGMGDGYATDSTGCIIILAIKLLSFYGVKEPLRNILHWKAEEGFKVKDFEVEKSVNGLSFTKIGTVAGSINNNFSYLFIDTKPFPGMIFYRLRIIERDGEVSYSKIIVLKTASQSAVTIYPNPGKGLATLYYYSPQPLNTQLLIYQADGRHVLSTPLKIAAGANYLPLDMRHLANGIYIIKTGEGGSTIKILIQK